MISRQDFLRHLLAISAASTLPGIYNIGCTPKKTNGNSSERLLVFDLHCHPGRFFFKGTEFYGGDEEVMRTVNQMNEGGLRGGFMSMVCDMLVLQRTETGIIQARTFEPGEAWQDCQRQLDVVNNIFPKLNARHGFSAGDLSAEGSKDVALFLACEGGDFLEDDIENVSRIYEQGVRSIQLIHYAANQIGDLQTQEPMHNGLSEFGKSVVRNMNELGMVIDAAHASFKTVQDIASTTSKPLILSHSILKMEEGRPIAARAISEDHALIIAETGGVIGAWPSGFNKSFDEYIDNILRLVDVVGIDHVGLGTDMDSNFRPVMDSYLQLPDWLQALRNKGLNEEEVKKIAGKNMVRVLNNVFSG